VADDPVVARSPAPLLLLLSGPNLSLLGERQPLVYGTATLADLAERAARAAADSGAKLEHLHSDHEGDLVAAVHGARHRVDAIVVNAAALSHYSWSLCDALAAFEGVVVEVHLSNPDAREPWRRTSVVTPVADGCVSGFGGLGYELAVRGAVRLVEERRASATA
jgi:3-dehydroquinate dehydratase-2